LAIRKHLVVLTLSGISLTGCGSNGTATNVSLSPNIPQAEALPESTPASASANNLESTSVNPELNSGTTDPELIEAAPIDQSAALGEAEAEANITLTCDANSEQIQTIFIDLINQVRAQPRQCGGTSHEAAGPLSWNAKLAVAAERHSVDMAVNNFFSHTGTGNTSAADRVDAVNYEWQFVGENLAAGQPSLQEAIHGWLSSPGHCRNIMNISFKEAGLACAENQSTEFGIYWTNVFGTQFE